MIFLFLAGCDSGPAIYAPVKDISYIDPIPADGIYYATPSDTIYSIAWRYGLDYRSLASRNRLKPPYRMLAGQKILLRKKSSRITREVVSLTQTVSPPVSVAKWLKPANGSITKTFAGLNKGINIAGQMNDPIYATAAGKVVYAGNGLRAYGNLIILKHNNTYLSAYAYSSRNLVREGEWVHSGQKIAEMGNSVRNGTILHFEIRKNGIPVNPLIYLAN